MTIEVTLGRLSIVDCFTAISHAEDVVKVKSCKWTQTSDKVGITD